MATFTSLGIGSGLDLNSLVSQLVALERRPLQTMQRQNATLQTQVSSFGKMTSLFGALQGAANKLNESELWSRSSFSSGDDSVVSAKAASNGSSAAAGNYAVTVQSLARNQTAVSTAALPGANDPVGSGTLTIDIGTWDVAGTTLAVKADTPSVQIAVAIGDTLQSLRDKINASGAAVTATLVTDTSGVRLSLQSRASGLENAFRIAATDDDGNPSDAAGLSRFAYDPGSGANQMQVRQTASNAAATVNGIAVQSSSNELNGVIEGLTLTLKQTSTAEITITASSDREGASGAIKAFVDAYNGLASYLSAQTRYDASTKFAGTLQGDSAVNGIQSNLRSLLGSPSGASSLFGRLSDIGIQAARDGTLSVNQATLDKALTNLPELKKAFGASDPANAANNGFAKRFATLATQVLGSDGSLTTRTEGLRKLISKNTDDQDRLNTRVDQFQARLVKQYTQMDSNLSRLNSLSSLVTQQLAALSRGNGY